MSRRTAIFCSLIAFAVAIAVTGCWWFAFRQRPVNYLFWDRDDAFCFAGRLADYKEPITGLLPLRNTVDREGKELFSWKRKVLLREEGGNEEKPWNDPENIGDQKVFEREMANVPGPANVALYGKDTIFDESLRRRPEDLPPNLVVLVQIRKCDRHWAQPGFDIAVEELEDWLWRAQSATRLGRDEKGFWVAFRNSDVWMLRHDVAPEALVPLLRISTAAKATRDALKPYRVPTRYDRVVP